MATQVCVGCTTRYACGLVVCPHCGSGVWEPSWIVDDRGGEGVSPGSSSSTSSENTEPTNAPQPDRNHRRVRAAASPSKPTEASSIARPVTGDRGKS